MSIIFPKSFRFSLIAIFVAILLFACSSGGGNSMPVAPGCESNQQIPELTGNPDAQAQSESGHYLMLYNLIYVDPDNPDGPKFDIVPLRESEIHLNILKLLEDGPCTNCFNIVGFSFPVPGTLDIDIQIDHPFDDLQFSVFDVRGIMMFQGSHTFPVADKTTSDPVLGDGALLNADGYTALFNGSTVTAPVGVFQKYYPGNFATPAVPNSIINGYKYYVTDNPSNDRNAFYGDSSGIDVQTFSIKLPTGPFVLGYAVDANWWLPISEPVDDPLTDFDLNANCLEPWKVVVTEEPIDNGLTDKGGQSKLIIDVYDWQGKSTHHEPVIECPELFDGALTAAWVSDGTGYSKYEVTVSNDKLASAGEYICLAGVEANENDPVGKPWLDLTGYQIITLDVSEVVSGGLMWAKRAGGSTTDKVYGITTLSDNSAVVTGWFTGSATFGPGDPNQTILTAADGYDIFIARYKQDGTLAWAKRAGGMDLDEGRAVATLSDDSTIVAGFFGSLATFGPGEPNQTVLTAAGYDIFVARYNPDGTLAWAKRAGGGSYYSLGIAPLTDDSAVITGGFSGSSTFGPGETHQTILTATAGGTDIFVASYNSDGTLAWAKRAGGSYYQDLSYEVTALADNSTVVTGAYGISATFGQGEPNATVLTSIGGTDIFIAQYNANGTLAWAKSAGGPLNDYGSAITTLSDSTTVVTGWYAGSAVFGMGEPNQTTLNAVGGFNIFVAHYNLDGTLAWVKGAEGSFVNEWGNGITTLSDDSTVVTGGYNISATFGPGDPNQTVLNSAGGYDIFIARYNTDGTIGWAKSAGGLYLDEGSGITALSDDSTVITGVFEGSSTFGLGESAQTIVTSVGESDIFIARYNP